LISTSVDATFGDLNESRKKRRIQRRRFVVKVRMGASNSNCFSVKCLMTTFTVVFSDLLTSEASSMLGLPTAPSSSSGLYVIDLINK
jgi:hypothetical protein